MGINTGVDKYRFHVETPWSSHSLAIYNQWRKTEVSRARFTCIRVGSVPSPLTMTVHSVRVYVRPSLFKSRRFQSLENSVWGKSQCFRNGLFTEINSPAQRVRPRQQRVRMGRTQRGHVCLGMGRTQCAHGHLAPL